MKYILTKVQSGVMQIKMKIKRVEDNKKYADVLKQTMGFFMMLLLPTTGLLLLLSPEPPLYFWVLFAIGCPLLFLGGKLLKRVDL